MAKYEVTLSLIVHTMVKVIVEADDKEAALIAASELMPSNRDLEAARAWKADITLKPPKTIELASKTVKGMHFEAASGGEKVKKIG